MRTQPKPGHEAWVELGRRFVDDRGRTSDVKIFMSERQARFIAKRYVGTPHGLKPKVTTEPEKTQALDAKTGV
jgi:hypothetical protein